MATILHGGIPVSLPAHWRQSAAYRRYRAGLANAKTFQAAVEYLGLVLVNPEWRLFAAADFAPQARYAQKFLNTAALYRRGSEDEQFTAIKAQQVLTRLLIATAGGHPREPVMDAKLRQAAESVRGWTTAVRVHWPDADDVIRHLARVAPWTVGRRRSIRALMAHKSRRPVHLAHQLAAWELGVSIRAIRQASRPRKPVILKSA